MADIRTLVPRVQRAVEGVVREKWQLDEDEVKDLCADACADVLLYTGTVFGSQLIVTHVDASSGAPDEYATDTALSPSQAGVIAAQAALTYFFHQFAGLKVSESIQDEASTWEYSLSPNLLQTQLKLLQSERDLALQRIGPPTQALDAYVSFLGERDRTTSHLLEPWVYGNQEGFGLVGAGGLEGDWRFGTSSSFEP